MIVCKNCGYKNQDSSDLCENCGDPLAREEAGKKRRDLLVLIIIAVVALAAVLTAAIYIFRSIQPGLSETGSSPETEDYTAVDMNGVDNAYITVSGIIAREEEELVLKPAQPVSVCALNAQNQIVKREGVTELLLSGSKQAAGAVGAEVSIRGKLSADGNGEFELQIVEMDIVKEAPAMVQKPSKEHGYRLIQADVTWMEAYEDCILRGGHLLQIDSEEEFQKVIKLIQEAGMEDVHFYLGGLRSENSQEYYWVDDNGEQMEPMLNPGGISWAASHWMEEEPSFVSGDDLEMYMNLVYFQGEWVLNDVPADITVYYPGRTGYIVEFDE